MNKLYVLLFYLKKTRLSENGTAPVYARETVNNSRFEFATKCRADSKKWNSVSQKVNGTTEEALSVNAYLKTLELQVYNAHRELLEKGTLITTLSFKKKLFGDTKEKLSIIEVFRQHNV